MPSGYLCLVTWQLRLVAAVPRLEEGGASTGFRFFPLFSKSCLTRRSQVFPRQPSCPSLFADNQLIPRFLGEDGYYHACQS